jgi:hypothetical protein
MTTFITKISNKAELDFGSDYNFARFKQYCKENIGKILRIEPEVSTRTLSQNKLYWKYLGIIEIETGNNANDLHEYFRRVFLIPKIIKVMGKEVKIPTSTTELKKNEFSDYLDKICAETGVPIPDTEAYLKECDLAPLK